MPSVFPCLRSACDLCFAALTVTEVAMSNPSVRTVNCMLTLCRFLILLCNDTYLIFGYL